MNTIIYVYINKFKDYPILYEYCTGLQQRGNKVYYFGISDRDERFVDSSGVEVIHVSKSSVKTRLSFASAFARLMRELKPDLVHVFHYRWCLLLPIVAFFRTKFIMDLRTVYIADNFGRRNALAPLKNRLTWFESLFYTRAIALTDEVRKSLKPSFGNIPVIPLGASISKFTPVSPALRIAHRKALGFQENNVLFLYSGTLTPSRKIDTLLQAFAKIARVNDQAHLLVVGNDRNNASTLSDLKAEAAELGLTKVTTFTGYIAYDELVKYYHVADFGLCYIPQVSHYDNQPPTKLFEYMAAGLVTISTKTTAIRDVITDGVNGILAEDTAEHYSAGMFRALSIDANELLQIIAEGNKTAERFSWDNIIDGHLIRFYQELGLSKTEAHLYKTID